jgi:hypothetical protein
MRADARRAQAREPLELDLPERKIILDARRHGRARRHARAARCAQADRGVHDPGQRRGRRDAGERALAADLPGARQPSPEKLVSLREFLKTIGISLPKGQALKPRTSTASSRSAPARNTSIWSTRWCCAARRRPNIRPRITAISGSTCAATPISPRRSAAMPTSSCTARCLGAGWGDDGLSDWDMLGSPRSPRSSPRPSAAPWRPSARPSTG